VSLELRSMSMRPSSSLNQHGYKEWEDVNLLVTPVSPGCGIEPVSSSAVYGGGASM
jgi:hypothetical protein